MKWKALVVLLGVFLLGVGGGVVLDRVALYPDSPPYMFRPPHRPPPVGRILHRLTRELDLSEAQQESVHGILIATRTELKTARQHMRKRVDDILKASEKHIQNVLKDEQREAFEQFMVEHRARREQRRRFKSRRHHRFEEKSN